MAARPRTLPAAASPVIAGTALAAADGRFAPLPALAALAGALLLQIAANLANDVFDYHKGADNTNRLGPLRVTTAGLLSPREVLTGMWITFALAAACGLVLILSAGWPVVVIGLASILAAIAYTGGPYPLGYHGLGELAVFIFFGPVAVIGTYFVQALAVSSAAIWISIPLGLLTVAILVINNLRDIHSDRAANKLTLAARYGKDWARKEYLAVITLAYLVLPVMVLFGAARPWVLLAWLTLPMFVERARQAYQLEGRALNLLLASTGQLELAYAVFLSLGLLLQTLLG